MPFKNTMPGKTPAEPIRSSSRLTIAVTALVLFGIFVLAYSFVSPKKRPLGELPQETVSTVVKGVLPDGEVRTLTGVIAGLEGSILTVDVPTVLAVQIPKETDIRIRTVRISQSTEVLGRVRKESGVYNAELRAYNSNRAAGANPPSPYTFSAIAIDELRMGDHILIRSNNDVKEALDFGASAVIRLK